MMSNFFHGMAWGIVICLLAKPFLDAGMLLLKNAWASTKAKEPTDGREDDDADA